MRPASRATALPRLFRHLPAQLELRDTAQLESLLATADALLGRIATLDELAELEWMLSAEPEAWPLSARVAVKLARSKASLARRRQPLHLSVVLPLYGEHQRMLRPEEHRLGEGCLDRKLRQLSWLFEGRARQHFELLIVDDGCPHASGQLAQHILATRHPHANARVSFLADAIDEGLPIVAPLHSVDDSRKGGAVHYGLWQATRRRQADHVVLYTDADLSTHLGQSGLLVEALERPGTLVAAGSRRHRLSVAVKGRSRSGRGRLFMYLWKQLLPEMAYVADTQCGFKAFPAQVARRLVESSQERGPAFDVELLLLCERSQRHAIASVPIAWIDSEEASTFVDPDPYLGMLRQIAGLARTGRRRSERCESFADAIEAMGEAEWQQAVEQLGPRLEGIDPSLDATGAPLPASDLLAVAA